MINRFIAFHPPSLGLCCRSWTPHGLQWYPLRHSPAVGPASTAMCSSIWACGPIWWMHHSHQGEVTARHDSPSPKSPAAWAGAPDLSLGAFPGPPVRLLLLHFCFYPFEHITAFPQLRISMVMDWCNSCLLVGFCSRHCHLLMLKSKTRSHPRFSSCLHLNIQPASKAGFSTSEPFQCCSLNSHLS